MSKNNTQDETTKICKYCQSIIPKKAKVCPVCRRTLKSYGCLTAILTLFAVFGGIGVFLAIFLGQNALIQKSVSRTSDKSEYITMSEFNQIESGMSYDEVKDIVGSSGEISVQSEGHGINITIITWYGNGLPGSNANITFTNGEVTAKAQVGLR